MTALEVRDLHVAYNRVPALRGIALTVETGEIVALIGPNGAGKTTTLSAIFGLVRTERGSVRFDGQELTGLTPERIVRRGLALVPEGRHIFQSMTVAENLALGQMAKGRNGQRGRVLDEVLEIFPILREYYKSPAARLSGGEQQQLAIARALLSGPRLLLLDEPSLGLAPQLVDMLFTVMGQLRERGTTILLVEQNARRTLRFADASYLLKAGRMEFDRLTPEMADNPAIVDAYLGGAR